MNNYLMYKDIEVDDIGLVKNMMCKMHIHTSNKLYNDCLQSGILGLYKARETYDSTKSSFSTHSYWFIKKELQNELSKMTDSCISYKCMESFKNNNKKSLSLDYNSNEEDDDLTNIIAPYYSPQTSIELLDDKRTINRIIEKIGDIELVKWVYSDSEITESDEKKYGELINKYFPNTSMSLKKMRCYLKSIFKKRIDKLKNSKEYKYFLSDYR